MTTQEVEKKPRREEASGKKSNDTLQQALLTALEEENGAIAVIGRVDTFLDEEQQQPYAYIVASPLTATYDFDEIDQLLLPIAQRVNKEIDDLFDQNTNHTGSCVLESAKLYEGDRQRANPGRLIVEEASGKGSTRKTFLYLFFDANIATAALSDLEKQRTLSPAIASGRLSRATPLPATPR